MIRTDSVHFLMAKYYNSVLGTAITVITDTVRIVTLNSMSKKKTKEKEKRLLLYMTNKAQRGDTVSVQRRQRSAALHKEYQQHGQRGMPVTLPGADSAGAVFVTGSP